MIISYPYLVQCEENLGIVVLYGLERGQFEEWDAMVQNELTGDHIGPQSIEKIKNKILDEVNRSLVWKVLAKEDRYYTPFYNAQLEELKKEHPNLTVDNNLHCFVSLPAFNQADIDRAFTNLSDIPAFQWDDEENT